MSWLWQALRGKRARQPASIGRLRAGRPETLVNSGLASRIFGDARFTRGLRRALWRGCDEYFGEFPADAGCYSDGGVCSRAAAVI